MEDRVYTKLTTTSWRSQMGLHLKLKAEVSTETSKEDWSLKNSLKHIQWIIKKHLLPL